MIKVENHEVTMFGELEELSAEITLLMATHYQAMVKHWGEERQISGSLQWEDMQ